jgi:hypothetical protein
LLRAPNTLLFHGAFMEASHLQQEGSLSRDPWVLALAFAPGGDAFALFYNASTKRVPWFLPVSALCVPFLQPIYVQVECLQGCGRSPAALTLEAVRKHPDMAGERAQSGRAIASFFGR